MTWGPGYKFISHVGGHVFLENMKTCFQLILYCFAMLNYSVYCKTARRYLVHWNIGFAEPPDVTFRGFFSTKVSPQIMEPNRELEKTYVGKSKEKLDPVDSDMRVTDVTSLFGPYVKFVAEEIGAIEPVAGTLFSISNLFSIFIHPVYKIFITYLLLCRN